MAKTEQELRKYEEDLHLHLAVIEAVARLRKAGFEEGDILDTLMCHAVELAATTQGPKRARYFLRHFLNSLLWSAAHGQEVCADCKLVSLDVGYGVKDRIWKSWAGYRMRNPEFLCIPCLEARIGRPIRPRDFESYGKKDPESVAWQRYQRLVVRMQRVRRRARELL